MKIKSLLIVLTMMSMNLIVLAGDSGNRPEKCGVIENTKRRLAENPGLAEQMARDEESLQQMLANSSLSRTESSNTVHTIPVVVHVVYKTSSQNISDAQILSQIDVLNEDFGKRNTDTSSVPQVWKPLASTTNFQFCMASTDPLGNPTNGIERRSTTVSSFSTNDDVKHYANGGMDAWDVSRYFNIWVCNLGGGLLGYAEFPTSSPSSTYGVVIIYNSFGRVGTLSYPYNKGRTATHEIGHCFNLRHIWGDDSGACTGGDAVADTPNQGDATYGCGTWPAYDACTGSTGNGYMWMNYMDYTDDRCMYMFTTGQASRMNSAMSTYYPSLFTSTACESPTSISNTPDNFSFSIYPNPSNGMLNMDFTGTRELGTFVNVQVVDALGKIVLEKQILKPNGQVSQLDLTGSSAGVYFVKVFNNEFNKSVRLSITN